MLKDISVRSEDGQIKVFWEWENEEIVRVDIKYKCSEIQTGDGTEFIKGGVSKHPGEQTSNALRKLSNEFGLYTFTFIPKMKNGADGEKIVIADVALGNPLKIRWRIGDQKEGAVVTFSGNQFTIKPGIVTLVYSKYQYVLQYEVSADTKLLFPMKLSGGKFFLRAAEPYDRLYQFVKD